MLTGEQIQAARVMLRWRQSTLAEASKVSIDTIKRLEGIRGTVAAQMATVLAIRGALERGGVVFLDAGAEGGAGVRLRGN